MVRRSQRKTRSVREEEDIRREPQQHQQDDRDENVVEGDGAGGADNEPEALVQHQQRRSVAAHVRDRQRAVAEREASRLARPEQRRVATLAHADRKKSAVSSTPFGIFNKANDSVVTGAATSAAGAVSEPEEWCGPFSVARQMIAKRDEARRLREIELQQGRDESGNILQQQHHPLDGMVQEMELEKKRKAHPSLLWKGTATDAPAPSSLYAKRQKRASLISMSRKVPTLFQLCVQFLVQNFEHVESLGDGDAVDSSVRTAIANELISQNKLDQQSLEALCETGMATLEMADLSQITQDQFVPVLNRLLPAGLQYLLLDQCGRCFGPKAVEALIHHAPQAQLVALAIGGAYLLRDQDAARMIQVTGRTVRSLQFKACPLLRSETCQSLVDVYRSVPRSHALLELVLEDLPMTADGLQILVSKPYALANLKNLSLRRLEALTDDLVAQFLQATGRSLEGLDLSDNYHLTDAALAALRRDSCHQLRSLTLSGLKHLTSAGLEALFMFVPNMDPPPMLRQLCLSHLDYEAVSDDVIQLVCLAATKRVLPSHASSLLSPSGPMHQEIYSNNANSPWITTHNGSGLVQLNIQGSAFVTNTAAEHLVAMCATSLQDVNISFCPRITDTGLGYLIDHCHDQLVRIEIWGNAQLTDQSLDGHRRVNDPTLEIIGAWMKKHNDRSMR